MLGRGLECQSERFDDFLVLAGQRISHGTVSETIQLEKGRWCRRLKSETGKKGLRTELFVYI